MKRKAMLMLMVVLLLLCVSSFSALAEDVTLRFSFPGSSEAERQWASDFKEYIEDKYPGVTIDYLHIPGGDLIQRITVMIAAGDVPDIIAVQEITDYVGMGALEPLDDYVLNDDQIDFAHFNEGTLRYSQVDGVTYAIPSLAIGYGLLVNTNLLYDVGLELEDLKTWDDLLAAAKAMTKDGNYGWAFCGSVPRFLFRDFYVAAASNGLMYDELSKPENKQRFVELMDFYAELEPYIAPAAQGLEWGDLHRYILDNRVGFIATGTYYMGYFWGFSPDSLEYLRPIQFPKGPSVDQPSSLVGSFGYGIFADSPNKEIAWQVVREAVNDRFAAQLAGSINVTALNTIPADVLEAEVEKYFAEHLDAQLDILDRWAVILDQNGVPQPGVLGLNEIERAYQDSFFMMLNGRLSPEEMYERFIAEVKIIEADYQ